MPRFCRGRSFQDRIADDDVCDGGDDDGDDGDRQVGHPHLPARELVAFVEVEHGAASADPATFLHPALSSWTPWSSEDEDDERGPSGRSGQAVEVSRAAKPRKQQKPVPLQQQRQQRDEQPGQQRRSSTGGSHARAVGRSGGGGVGGLTQSQRGNAAHDTNRNVGSRPSVRNENTRENKERYLGATLSAVTQAKSAAEALAEVASIGLDHRPLQPVLRRGPASLQGYRCPSPPRSIQAQLAHRAKPEESSPRSPPPPAPPSSANALSQAARGVGLGAVGGGGAVVGGEGGEAAAIDEGANGQAKPPTAHEVLPPAVRPPPTKVAKAPSHPIAPPPLPHPFRPPTNLWQGSASAAFPSSPQAAAPLVPATVPPAPSRPPTADSVVAGGSSWLPPTPRSGTGSIGGRLYPPSHHLERPTSTAGSVASAWPSLQHSPLPRHRPATTNAERRAKRDGGSKKLSSMRLYKVPVPPDLRVRREHRAVFKGSELSRFFEASCGRRTAGASTSPPGPQCSSGRAGSPSRAMARAPLEPHVSAAVSTAMTFGRLLETDAVGSPPSGLSMRCLSPEECVAASGYGRRQHAQIKAQHLQLHRSVADSPQCVTTGAPHATSSNDSAPRKLQLDLRPTAHYTSHGAARASASVCAREAATRVAQQASRWHAPSAATPATCDAARSPSLAPTGTANDGARSSREMNPRGHQRFVTPPTHGLR
jgi:hypothetical protein